jgi:hypothetical protein
MERAKIPNCSMNLNAIVRAGYTGLRTLSFRSMQLRGDA